MPLIPSTAYYGEIFEQMVVLSLIRRVSYESLGYRLMFLRTEDQAEVDLVIERPGKSLALVEIKSSAELDFDTETMALRHLKRFAADFPEAECFCISQSALRRRIGRIECLHWREGIALL